MTKNEDQAWLVVAITKKVEKSLALKWEKTFAHAGAVVSKHPDNEKSILCVSITAPDRRSAELLGKQYFDRVVNYLAVLSVEVFAEGELVSVSK